MYKILFFLLFCSTSMFGLGVITYTPSTLLCGTTTVTGTFVGCEFNGTVLINVSGGVELGGSSLVTVVAGVMSFDIIIDGADASPFNINGVVLASDDLTCAAGSEQFSTSLSHTCVYPVNNDCSGAKLIPINFVNCNFVTSTTLNQTASGIVPVCGGDGYNDLWYEFVANGPDVTLELGSLPGTLVYWALYDGCGGPEVSCGFLNTFGAGTIAMINSLTTGNTYKVQLLTLANASGGDQEICLYNNVTVALDDIQLSLTNYTTYNTLSFETSEEASLIQVERKINDAVDFEKIGELEVIGNNAYTFNDERLEVFGNYAYRLKIYDIDGNVDYSNIVSTRNINQRAMDIQIYPNPCTDIINIDLGSYSVEGRFSIEILNADLKKIRTIEDFHTLDQHSVDVSDLSNGVYFVRIRSVVDNRVIKFVKI